MTALVGPNSIVEGDFRSNGHGNLEAALFNGGQLQHVFGKPLIGGMEWTPGQVITSDATGPASIIQSDFMGGDHGNFEVVALEGNELVHYFHDNSDVSQPWQRGQVISTVASGPGAIIQSDFRPGDHGNFEVVVLEGNELVHYFHDNSDASQPWQRGQVISTVASGPGAIIQSDFRPGDHGNFEVVVLEGNELVHYFHDNSDASQPWQRGHVISTVASGPGAIIQSDFRPGDHGNFEVVVLEGNELVHYFHDNSDVSQPWQRGQVISVAATGPGCIARSSYGPGGPGNFEVFVQELTKSVVHYWHHNVDVALPWWRSWRRLPGFAEDFVASPDMGQTGKVAQLTGECDRQLGVATLGQTTSRFGVVGTDLGQSFEHEGGLAFLFGDTNTDGQVRSDPSDARDSIAFTNDRRPSEQGIRLRFNPTFPHVDGIDQGAFCVPADGVSTERSATGPASIVQSDFKGGDHGNFEVVALEGNELVHYFHDNSYVSLPWARGQVITRDATGPASIIQSDFMGGDHGNFEVVALEGNELVHYFHDNSDVSQPWQRGQVISTVASGPGAIIQSDFRPGDHGNFEVVALEGNELVHYFHDNSDVSQPWQRGHVISTVASGPGAIIQSDFRPGDHGNFEVVVLEGNELVHYFHDNSDASQPWQRGHVITRDATGPASIIQSDFRPGDHGNFEVVVLEGNELVHYFHDNSDASQPWQRGHVITRDATGPASIIQSDFRPGDHGNFEVVVLEGNELVHYFHDNSDVSQPWQRGQRITRATMHVFFTTDHVADPGTDNNSMGRSVLARSEDGGVHFGRPVLDLSTDKFINVSLQVVQAEQFPGLPDESGPTLLLWGSGGYRRSNVHLACVSLANLEDRFAYWFFTGTPDAPRWDRDEHLARPLFLSGSVGELSVRWNPFLSRFVLLYNSDNPGFILESQSPTPWGPWTERQNIFDLIGALGRFVHRENSGDGLSDPDREGVGGGAYGPYTIGPYTTLIDDGVTRMFFVLSVWNPYNTMLMSAVVRARS